MIHSRLPRGPPRPRGIAVYSILNVHRTSGSTTMTILGAVLLILTFLVWIFFAACASTLRGSDAAGNGLTQSFAMLSGIALWMLLAVLLVIAGLRAGFPSWTTLAAVILVPASAAAALSVVQMLSGDFYRAKWPLVVPILAPLLILAYAIWGYFPSLRAAIPSPAAGGILWGGVLILSVLPWPTITRTSHQAEQRNTELSSESQAQADKEKEQRDSKDREEWTAKFEKLPPDASLFQLSEFTRHGEELRLKAFKRIQKLPTRQSDAEDMLAHGIGWPLLEVQHLDLEATPLFCEQTRRFLANCAKAISPPVPCRPYDWEKARVDPFLPAIQWLVERHCDCTAELTAVESAVRAYPDAADRNRTLATLAGILQARHP